MAQQQAYALGIDLDNVTADYTGLLRKFMMEEYGWTAKMTPEPTDYDWLEAKGWPFESRKDYLDKHCEMIRRGGFLTVEPIEEAVYYINKLKKDHNIIIDVITHRILGDNDNDKLLAMQDTARWLLNKGVPLDNLSFHSDKKKVSVDALIDDSPYNITSVRDNGGYAIVFDQEYNRHLHGPRVNNWEEAYEHVLEHKKRIGL